MAKYKTKSIFDDDVSVDAAKTIFYCNRGKEDSDEDDDMVNFDGSSVAKSKSKDSDFPKPPMPDMSNLAVPSVPRTSTIVSPSPTIPKSTSLYGGHEKAFSLGHNRSSSLNLDLKPKGEVLEDPKQTFTKSNEAHKQSLSSLNSYSSLSDIDEIQQPRKGGIGEPNESFTSGRVNSSKDFDNVQQPRRRVIGEPNESFTSGRVNLPKDIDDVIDSSKKQMSASDMQREIQRLKEALERAKKDKWAKVPIQDTLRRIINGEPYSLEMYRSLADKLELVDTAIRSHDGNAVTAAILFLKNTISKQIFNRELIRRPSAANHYLNYLKEHFDFADYIDTLCLLGRTEEAAIFKFKLALPTPDVNLKISKLKEAGREQFHKDQSLSFDLSLVEEYIDLLERQRPIEESDARQEAAGGSQIFKDFPRKRSLVDMPVVTTLYYCSLYHFDLSENSLGSPAAIRKRHQISEKQYVWTAIAARAKVRRWKDIETILTAKGWFGGTKLKAVIGYDKIVGILHRNTAPLDILDKYLAMMSDPEERLSLAMKVGCYKAVIDTYASLKDRTALEAYASKFERYSKEGLYAHDVLNGSIVKWR